MDDRAMSLSEHLSELRGRLFVMIGTVAVLFMGGFVFVRPILNWIIHTTPVHHVIVTGVTEAFFALVEVDLVLALTVASPVILYEMVAFVLPGLTSLERRVLIVVAGPGLILFVLGSAAGYLWVVPLVLKVMLSFTDSTVQPCGVSAVSSDSSLTSQFHLEFWRSFP
jgi:sec-independent protein translocase protein TatC